jgi:hypothetical protein
MSPEKDIILSDNIDDSSLYTDILIDTTYTDNIDIISSTIIKDKTHVKPNENSGRIMCSHDGTDRPSSRQTML